MGGIFTSSMRGERILRLQRPIILNLFSKHFPRHSYETILYDLQIRKVSDVYKLNIGCFMYRLINHNFSASLGEYLDLHSASHNINTRQRNDFIVPFSSVDDIRLNFKYQFITIWNSVPHYIKVSKTISQFKNNYRQFLLTNYN